MPLIVFAQRCQIAGSSADLCCISHVCALTCSDLKSHFGDIFWSLPGMQRFIGPISICVSANKVAVTDFSNL